MKKDKLLGLISIAFGILVLVLTLTTVDPRIRIENDPGPRMFPFIISAMFVVSGGVLFLRKDEKEGKAYMTGEEWKRLFKLFCVLGLYILMIYLMGFLFGTFVLLYVVSYMFSEGKKKKLGILLFAIITTLVIYVAFKMGLKVYLPTGKIPSMLF